MRKHVRRYGILVACLVCWGGLVTQARADPAGDLDGGAGADSLDDAVVAFATDSPTDGPGTNITTSGGGCAVAAGGRTPLLPGVGLVLAVSLLAIRRVPRL